MEINRTIRVRIYADTENLPISSGNLSIDFSKTEDFAKTETITVSVPSPASTGTYYDIAVGKLRLNPLVSSLELTKDDTLYYRVYGVSSGVILSNTSKCEVTKSIPVSSLTTDGTTTHTWYYSKAVISAKDTTNIPVSGGTSEIIVYYSYVSFKATLGTTEDRGTRWKLSYASAPNDGYVDGLGNKSGKGSVRFGVVTVNGTGADSIRLQLTTSGYDSGVTLPSSVFSSNPLTIKTYEETEYKVYVTINYTNSNPAVANLSGAKLEAKWTDVSPKSETYTIDTIGNYGNYSIMHDFTGKDDAYQVILTLTTPSSLNCSVVSYGDGTSGSGSGNKTFTSIVTKTKPTVYVTFDVYGQ